MKILTVVGARPQFVKAAAVSRVWRKKPNCSEILVHTGQHYDENMSDVFFRELQIPKPDYHLNIGSGDHGAQTGKMLEAIEQVIKKEQPQAVLVYGDTNSTLAGALAAAKLHIPVAHVEAGLRSFNRRMPEEINRVMADHLSTILYAPTSTAVQNLAQEGISGSKVVLSGDVMLDVTLFAKPIAEKHSRMMQTLNLTSKQFILSTLHRAENTDSPQRLISILHGLAELAHVEPVILPLHPRTRKMIAQNPETERLAKGIKIIDPVGYLDMLILTREAAVVVTDSGGLQKEAFFHKTPCVTMRDETEWVELVECGWNRLVHPEPTSDFTNRLIAAVSTQRAIALPYPSLYGSGNSADLICDSLCRL